MVFRNDTVFVEVDPIITKTQQVRYNAHNRKTVIGELTFTLAGISSDSSLNISDHGLITGQKVIHQCYVAPATGLLNNQEYYAYVVDTNNVKLCESIYQTKQPSPKFVDISNDSSGSLLPVNPPLKFYKDTSVRFDEVIHLYLMFKIRPYYLHLHLSSILTLTIHMNMSLKEKTLILQFDRLVH